MVLYLFCFVLILIANAVPGFAPPTWTVISYFVIRYHLPIGTVVGCGVIAATLGRAILSMYIRSLSRWTLNERTRENLDYVGKTLLNRSPYARFLFIFVYSLTPLSTTVLFVAAGLTRVTRTHLLAGFALGRLVSYSVLAYSAQLLVDEAQLWTGATWKGIVSAAAGVVVILAFIFIDWRMLLESKALRLNFHIFRYSHHRLE